MTDMEDGLFLLNRELILREMIELGTMRIAKALDVDLEKVSADVKVDKIGKLSVNFEVDDFDDASPMEEQRYAGIMQEEWSDLRVELNRRLKGMHDTRN